MSSILRNVVVGIPTYRRPKMLTKLINSLFECDTNAVIGRVDILVVDNDSERSAEALVNSLSAEAPLGFRVLYHSFPVKGLVNVRNALFEQALALEPDFLAFIDDDEYASPQWLRELVLTLERNQGDLAVGPVIPVLVKKVPRYISHWFKYHSYRNYSTIDFIETGNLIVRGSLLLQYPDLRFDQRFNTTGAEDSYFGITALKKGIKILWAGEAVAYETIPEKRSTIKWLLRRSYSGAITYTYINIIEKRYRLLFRKFVVNFIYLAIGIAALILVPFQTKFKYFGAIKLAESMGGFAGLLNIRYHEYAKGR